MRIGKILVAGLAGSNGVGLEYGRRRDIVPAMTVDTIGQIALVLGLEMSGVMQFRRGVTLLAIAGDLCLERTEAFRRVRLVRVLIALLRTVAVGAKDRRRRMHSMHRIVQRCRVDADIQRVPGRKRDRFGATDVTELAG